MEHMLYTCLDWYLKTTGCFHKTMAGFCFGRSATVNAIDLIGSIQQTKVDGLLTAVIFLSVSKAYDSILHGVIIATLQQVGVGRTTLSWIHSFLTESCSSVLASVTMPPMWPTVVFPEEAT